MKSKGIPEDAKFGRICLTLGVDAHLWYDSIIHVDNVEIICTDNSLNWDKQKKNNFKDGGPFSLMRQLMQLIPML